MRGKRRGEPVTRNSVANAPQSDEDAREIGQNRTDTPCATADLAMLHFLMGHYARMLWDIQHTRVALSNRLYAMQRDGIRVEFMDPVREALGEYGVKHRKGYGVKQAERAAARALERAAGEHPMAPWIKAQRGIGPGGFGRLIAITGPLDRFPTVSKLWKYLGLAVIDGHAQRMTRGELASHTNCPGGHLRNCKANCTRDHHPNCSPDGFGTAFSPQGRVVCYQLGEAIVKQGRGGPYRAEYDRMKAYYESERPDWTQQRRHDAALRKAVKDLVRDMWVEWRRVSGDAHEHCAPFDSTDLEQAA